LALAVVAVPAVAALGSSPGEIVDRAVALANQVSTDPQAVASDPVTAVGDLVNGAPQNGGSVPKEGVDPGFAERVRGSLDDQLMLAGLGTMVATGLGLAGFALVTRHLDPKVALENPQRSMLYGFIRGNPGVHLKKLSDEFGMKTSSILWHIRKLESAELVRSDRANGFRVFYPVEGGQLVRQVSRAVTALQNSNALSLFGHVERHPGATIAQVATATGIHAGTVRWHLRKLKEFALIDEVERDGQGMYFATALGQKSLATLLKTAGGAGLTNPIPAVLAHR
jgi:predicted transcriptional regulator